MGDPKRLVSAGYDQVAAEYARLEDPGDEWPRGRLLNEVLAGIDSGSTVLDLGCGNGVPALREIAKDHQAVGIDLSRTQVDLARVNVPEAEVIHGDAAEIEFPPGSFAAVVSFYMFDHLPRDRHGSLLARIRDWLTDDGLLLFSVEPEDEPGDVHEWLGTPMFFSHYAADETLELVLSVGFEVIRSWVETQREGGREVDFLWVLARPARADASS